MRIILAPAKKMQTADDDFVSRSLPVFLNKTEVLLEKMRSMESAELKKMWKCSDQIVRQNEERLRTMDLRNRLSPAVFSYIGLAYQHMAPGAMTEEQLDYLQEHLRILSGFYGALKPFDGVTPYRLEMQAIVPQLGDLYSFWGDALYKEVRDEDGVIVNLASKEYSSGCLRGKEERKDHPERHDGQNGKRGNDLVDGGKQCAGSRGTEEF